MNKEKYNKYERLRLVELQTIYVMRADKKSMREIAEVVKRAVSTVCKALNNYKHPCHRVWRRMTALEKAKHVFDEMQRNRARAGNHGHIRDAQKRHYVIGCLVDEHLSPEIIAKKMPQELDGKTICAKTIYTFTKVERSDLQQYLFERGEPRRQRIANRRGRFRQAAPKKRRLTERSTKANKRKELGHWEGDTIVSKKGGSKAALLTLRERVTRQLRLFLLPNLEAHTAQGALRAFLETTPSDFRKSITLDNGAEFGISELSKLEGWYPELKLYYCDPYCAWQRGAVENANGRIRWYFPKGTDFGEVTYSAVHDVQERLNRRPMKCLNYRSPSDIFKEKLPLAA